MSMFKEAYPLQSSRNTAVGRLAWKRLQLDKNLPITVTRTADGLFRDIGINGLKRP